MGFFFGYQLVNSYMSRKILGTVFALLLVAGIVVLLWFWYLNRQQTVPNTLNNSGNINTNIPVDKNNTNTVDSVDSLSPSKNKNNNINSNSSASATSNGKYDPTAGTNIVGYTADGIPFYHLEVATGSIPTTSVVLLPRATTTPGAQWIFSGDLFNPSAINNVNDASPNGSGGILLPTSNITAGAQNGTDLLGAALAVTAIGTAACTAGLLGTAALAGGTSAAGAAASIAAVPTFDANAGIQLSVQTGLKSSDTYRDNFLNCVTRTIARAALQQITASVVNWINTGFHGKPTFIQNYQQFFAGVADQAAGEYIKGSALSFLCSPFSLKIRIALAQSYANRNAAPTCSLTGVVKNINRFMDNFAEGGWQGLIQFTTVPTNNPFGAYMYAQAGLQSSVASALGSANRNVSVEGFLNMQQAYNCKADPSSEGIVNVNIGASVNSASNGGICPSGCQCRTTTPGSVIAGTLTKQLNMPSDQLNMAKNFDEIIGALMTQLLTKALYGGITNLSNPDAYTGSGITGAQQQAAVLAQDLLTKMQADTARAQQYGYIEQGSIADIQGSQARLNDLANCWNSIASSTTDTSKRTEAETQKTEANTSIATLQSRISVYNNEITHANAAISTLEQLQSSVLNSASLAEVEVVGAQYTTAGVDGQIFTTSDLTTAQQNRATLQQELGALNNATTVKLTQCYATVN